VNSQRIFRRILLGYWQRGKTLLTLLGFLAAAGAVSFLIVFPLWLFATRNAGGYSLFCLLLLGAGLAFYLIRKITGQRNREILPESRRQTRIRRKRLLLSSGRLLLVLLCLYILFLLFSSGAILPGILAAVFAFFFLGWLFFGRIHGGRKPGQG